MAKKLIEQENIILQEMVTPFDLLILMFDGNELFNDLHFETSRTKKD